MPNENSNLVKRDQSTEVNQAPGGYSMPAGVTPGQLLQLAVESGAGLEKLEKLMELQERHERREAEKQFNYAISDFQKEVPRIVKRKQGHGYSYAPLGDIAEQIKGTAAKFGLSWKWTNDFVGEGSAVNVTCHIRHVAGHVEQTTVNMIVEQPNKMQTRNQMIGVAVTYGQRYSLIGALGLSTADDDMDGRLDNEFQKKPPYTQFKADLDKIKESIRGGRTAETIIQKIEQTHKVSDTVKSKIYLIEKELNTNDGAEKK